MGKLANLLVNVVLAGLMAYATVTAGGPVWAGIAVFGLIFVLWCIFDAIREIPGRWR